jgi:threonine/homoserine/homoserine lactone efflux protein
MMPSFAFLLAAFFLAIAPGPGIAYVLARTIAGGKSEGIASSFGAASGGLVHVLAGALGLSILLAKSALAFSAVKYAGAAYLIYLGVKTLVPQRTAAAKVTVTKAGVWRAYRDGIVVEVLNVKTALFFLALIPEFITLKHAFAPQFILLGSICIFFNTSVDILVVCAVNRFVATNDAGARRGRWLTRLSGLIMLALGLWVALGRI